jgi:hypothetical protein
MRPMSILFGLLVSTYLFVWGITWVAGDLSYAITVFHDDGMVAVTYPGVLFGGLPPSPVESSINVPLIACAAGAVALGALGALLFGSIRSRRPGRR